METHIKILGILHIIMGAFAVLLAVAFFIIFSVLGLIVDDIEAQFVFILLQIFPFFMLILSLPGIIGGINFLKHKEWARILILILGILRILDIPFGTALGIYTLVIVTNRETQELFH